MVRASQKHQKTNIPTSTPQHMKVRQLVEKYPLLPRAHRIASHWSPVITSLMTPFSGYSPSPASLHYPLPAFGRTPKDCFLGGHLVWISQAGKPTQISYSETPPLKPSHYCLAPAYRFLTSGLSNLNFLQVLWRGNTHLHPGRGSPLGWQE